MSEGQAYMVLHPELSAAVERTMAQGFTFEEAMVMLQEAISEIMDKGVDDE